MQTMKGARAGTAGASVQGSITSCVRSMSPAPVIEITTTGCLAVRCDGALVTQWRSQKARELLAYLATREDGRATRRNIQVALWPDEELADTSHLLRTALWRLRTILDRPGNAHNCPAVCQHPANGLLSAPVTPFTAFDLTHASVVLGDRRCLVLNPARVRSDLAAIRAQYAEAMGQQSLPAANDASAHRSLDAASYSTPATDTSRCDDVSCAHHWLHIALALVQPVLVEETFPWLASVRRTLRQECLEAFDQARTGAEATGDSQLVLQALEHRLQLDVTHEPSIAAVMRLCLEHSAPTHAVTYYRAYRAALTRRYGVSEATLALPSVEVQRLFSSAVSAVENAAENPAPVDEARSELSASTSTGNQVKDRTADAQAPPSRTDADGACSR